LHSDTFVARDESTPHRDQEELERSESESAYLIGACLVLS
jgi:hypothetical protein